MRHRSPRILLGLTLATIATALVTSCVSPKELRDLPPGFSRPVLALEFVTSAKDFEDIAQQPSVTPPGEWASTLFWHGTLADLFFIAAYGLLWFYVLQRAAGPRWRRLQYLALVAIVVAAAADYVEDWGIIHGLHTAVAPAATIRIAATIKWLSLGVVFLALVERFWGAEEAAGAASTWLNRFVAIAYGVAGLLVIGGTIFWPRLLELSTLPVGLALLAHLPVFVLAYVHRPPETADPNFTDKLDDVRKQELEYITRRRMTDPTQPAPCADVANTLVGLSLSGGGIRSATTNLGILQALAGMGILPIVDYLSTVSGGGYIGGCLTALLSIHRNAEPGSRAQYRYKDRGDLWFSTRWTSFPFNPKLPDSKGPCCAPQAEDTTGKKIIAHLRTHGNFLIARRGLLKRDALRAVGLLLTGIVYHLLTTATIFFFATLLLMGLAHALDPNLRQILEVPAPPDRTEIARVTPTAGTGSGYLVDKFEVSLQSEFVDRFWRAWDGMIWQFRHEHLAWALVAGAVLTLLVFVFFVVVTRPWLEKRPKTWEPGETKDDRFARLVLNTAAAALIASIPLACWLIRGFTHVDDQHMGWIAEPFMVLAGARIANFALYPFIARADFTSHWFELWSREFRSLWGAYQAMTTYGMLAALAFALLPIVAYAAVNVSPWTALTPVVSLLFSRLMVSRAVTSRAERLRIPTEVLHFLLGVAVAVAVAFTLAGFATLAVYYHFDRPTGACANPWLLAAGGSGLLLLALSVVGDINRISPHYFYRDRLLETYLMTEFPGAGKRMETFTDTTGIRLQEMHGVGPKGAKSLGNSAPYTLISAAINLAGSRDLTRKDRKSGYFLFSKYYCGSRQTGYRTTTSWRDGGTKLSRALTISGAAVSAAMGAKTFFAEAFVTSIFNLRLGFWTTNPRTNASDTLVFWPRYMFQEVFGRTSERLPLVNLSDGGHTGDNVGIYPLLERRCQVIVACDAEADAGLSFGSFTEALRHAYVDLGVDIDIDLSMIRPDPKTGLSKSHCAVGRIRYPECPNRPNWLIYLKNSITGDEPAPVTNYRMTCPDFPHESTADQFFDDAQFESYRALGVHIAEGALGFWAARKEVRDALAQPKP